MRLPLLVLILGFSVFCLGETTSLPNVELVDQNGHAFQTQSLAGNHLFVSFLFTHCPMPGACPLTVMKAKQLGRWWKQKLPWISHRFLMITMDPARDTPEELKKFAEKRGVDFSDMIFATTTPENLELLKKTLGVNGRPAPDGNFYHDAKSFLFDSDLKLLKTFTGNQWAWAEVLCSIGVPLMECPRTLARRQP